MTDCDKCKEYDKEKNYCPVFCNVINDTLTDRAIEELEKIKAEIINCFSQENDIDSDAYNHALDIAISIVHDHISELKGEQK